MNEQNLKPFRSENEARENGTKGGKASGESRRYKKFLRECLEALLEKEITDKNGSTITGAEAVAAKLFQQALQGNIKAFEIIRDTVGEKYPEKKYNYVSFSDIDPDVIAQVERMVNETD